MPRAVIAPSSVYSAKFSVPFAIAVALIDGAAGLDQFTEARAAAVDAVSRSLFDSDDMAALRSLRS